MDYAHVTDKELVRYARSGSERAYRELLSRYQRPVFSLIFRMVRNRERAEDLAQETFIRVFDKVDSYDPSYKFSSWIFKIANNLTIDSLRKKRVKTVSMHGSAYAGTDDEMEATRIDAVSEHETPEEEYEARELGSEIEQAIGQLRPEYRGAIVMRHVEGRSYEEISEILDLPLGTVKTYIHRARKELRAQLEHLRAS